MRIRLRSGLVATLLAPLAISNAEGQVFTAPAAQVQTPAGVAQNPNQAVAQEPATVLPGVRRASYFLNTPLYLQGGQTGGQVSDFVLNSQGGIDYFVVSNGGQFRLVPYTAAQVDWNQRRIATNLNSNGFNQVPTFTQAQWGNVFGPQSAYMKNLNNYFGGNPDRNIAGATQPGTATTVAPGSPGVAPAVSPPGSTPTVGTLPSGINPPLSGTTLPAQGTQPGVSTPGSTPTVGTLPSGINTPLSGTTLPAPGTQPTAPGTSPGTVPTPASVSPGPVALPRNSPARGPLNPPLPLTPTTPGSPAPGVPTTPNPAVPGSPAPNPAAPIPGAPVPGGPGANPGGPGESGVAAGNAGTDASGASLRTR